MLGVIAIKDSFIDLNKYFSSFYDRDSSMPALEMEEDEDSDGKDSSNEKVDESSEKRSDDKTENQ